MSDMTISFDDALQVIVQGPVSEACTAELDRAMPDALVHIRHASRDGMAIIPGGREYLFAPVDLPAQEVGPHKHGFSAGFVGPGCVRLEIVCSTFHGELPGDWSWSWPRGNPLTRTASGLPQLGMTVAELHARLEPIVDAHQTYQPAPPPKRVPTAAARFSKGEIKTISFGQAGDDIDANGWNAVAVEKDGSVPRVTADYRGNALWPSESLQLPAGILLSGLCIVTIASSNPDLVKIADYILAAGDDVESPWGKRTSLLMVNKHSARTRLFAGSWMPAQFENEPDPRLRSFAPGEWTQTCAVGNARIELHVRTGERRVLRLQDYTWPSGSPLDTNRESQLRRAPKRADVVRDIEAALRATVSPADELQRAQSSLEVPAIAQGVS